MLDHKTILVTGGAGAIGSNLLRKLMKYNCKIIVVDDLTSGYVENIPKTPKITFIEGDIANDDTLKKAFSKKIDIIYHLAAFFANQNSVDHPEQDLKTNGEGTLKLLQYAVRANVERFVYASSSCVYGNVQGSAEETTKNYHLDTPYAITKLLGEYYAQYYHENHGVPVVILRFFNSFGPGERPGKYRNVIPNFIWRAMHNKPLIVYGTGEETRDFNWIENTSQALVLAGIKKEAVGEIFNVGSGEETKVIDLAKAIFKVLRKPENIVYEPRRSWDTVLRRRANVDKAKKTLGYKPDIGNLEEKLKLTYAWMKTIETKKILMVTPRQWDLQWGQEKDLIHALVSTYEVTILELLDYANLPTTYENPERSTLIKRKTRYKPGVMLGIANELRNLKDSFNHSFDIYITYLTAGSLLATLFARLRGKKVLLIYADDIPELNRSSSYVGYLATKYFFNPLSALFSHKIVATARLLAKDISCFGKNVTYIPNGVDIATYKTKREKKSRRYTIAFVGGFGEWVNFDLLLACARDMPNVHFLLIGDGPQFEYVKEQSLKNVTLTGMIPKDKVIEQLADVDVCTIPFKVNRLTHRVSPIKLFEYWALKKPVISTSFYEVKETGKDILLFADTKKQFITAIESLRDEELRRELGEKGYREVIKYDWQKLSAQYYDVIEEL